MCLASVSFMSEFCLTLVHLVGLVIHASSVCVATKWLFCHVWTTSISCGNKFQKTECVDLSCCVIFFNLMTVWLSSHCSILGGKNHLLSERKNLRSEDFQRNGQKLSHVCDHQWTEFQPLFCNQSGQVHVIVNAHFHLTHQRWLHCKVIFHSLAVPHCQWLFLCCIHEHPSTGWKNDEKQSQPQMVWSQFFALTMPFMLLKTWSDVAAAVQALMERWCDQRDRQIQRPCKTVVDWLGWATGSLKEGEVAGVLGNQGKSQRLSTSEGSVKTSDLMEASWICNEDDDADRTGDEDEFSQRNFAEDLKVLILICDDEFPFVKAGFNDSGWNAKRSTLCKAAERKRAEVGERCFFIFYWMAPDVFICQVMSSEKPWETTAINSTRL